MKKILILLLLVIPCVVFAEEMVRTWKSKTRKTILEAVWNAERDHGDKKVTLKTAAGKRYTIPLENLSPEAQQHIAERHAKKMQSQKADEDFGLEEETLVPSREFTVVPRGNRYALLIGVNAYSKPIRSLKFCAQDMKVLAESFQKIDFPEENIVLMTDDSDISRRPTGENIRRQIEMLTKWMTPDDLLVVAFSGHGTMVGENSYLCPSDTNLKRVDSLISREWAFAQLDQCAAKQKIFLVDACRDEFSFGGEKSQDGAQTLEDPTGAKTRGFILIASCDKKQKSWEHPDLQQGVFSHFVAQGILGEAQNEEGYISVLGLFHYVSRKTKMYVYHRLNEAQVPTLKQGGEMTDFYLAKVDKTTPTVPTSGGHTAGEQMTQTVTGN